MTTVRRPNGSSCSSPQAIALIVIKFLLVVVILLLMPQFVRAKNRKKRRMDTKVKSVRLACRTDMDKCGTLLFLEESTGCVSKCMSLSCHKEHYELNPLEDGEVDFRRWNAFEGCVRQEIKRARRS